MFVNTPIKVNGGNGSNASTERKNESRCIGGEEKVERKAFGDIADHSFDYLKDELGCIEIGLQDGAAETKTMNETDIKCPKMLKDFINSILNKYRNSDRNSLKTVGLVIDGLHISGLTMECPRGSACVVKRTERLEFPDTIEKFAGQIVPLLDLAYNVRQIVLNGVEVIKNSSRSSGVFNYSLKKRSAAICSCLTPSNNSSRTKKSRSN